MKKLLIIAMLIGIAQASFCQKGTSQFGFIGGYGHFTEVWHKGGYDVGIEFKHYVKNRFFVVANFHAGVNDGTYETTFSGMNTKLHTAELRNMVKNSIIGLGLGGDALSIGRHKIYVQGTAGIGSTERLREHVFLYEKNGRDVVEIEEDLYKETTWALTMTAGYDFRVTDWLAIGVNYTAFMIGTEYDNGFNGKIGWIF